MKKFEQLIATTLFILFSTVIFITSCNKNQGTKQEEENSLSQKIIPKELFNFSFNGLKIPDGTTTEILNNGSTVRLNFPNGYFLAGTTKEGKMIIDPGTEYTCTGNCTKGCDVFYAGGQFGCTACDPSTIVCTGKAKSLTELNGMGFINLNAGIVFLKKSDEISKLLKAPDSLLHIPVVRKGMIAFNLKIHGTENPDFSDITKFREVGLILYGCLVSYMIPVTYNSSKSTSSSEELIDAAKWSCRCDAPAGSSGCTKDSGIGYKACISGACTSCTMIMD